MIGLPVPMTEPAGGKWVRLADDGVWGNGEERKRHRGKRIVITNVIEPN